MIVRCTSMGKVMGPCVCISHDYLGRIVPRFGFYVHENECIDMLLMCLYFYVRKPFT